MAIGKFRLYYMHMDARHACEGVQYRLVNQQTGSYFSYGKTSAAGETKEVETVRGAARCRLEVLNHHTGEYEAPDLHGVWGTSVFPELSLSEAAGQRRVIESVRVKPYFRVRFHTRTGNKPLAGARFTAYQIDAQGREAIARDLDRGNPITGVTNAQGETGVIFCAAPLVFKFEIPGSSVKVSSPRWLPFLKGLRTTRYDLTLKTISAASVSRQADPVVTLHGKNSLPILISPADSELIAVPQSAFDEFECISGLLEQVVANGHRAKLDLSRSLESGRAEDIEAAEKALGVAEDRIKSVLNENFSKAADLKEVITFESIPTGKNSATGAKQMGLRRRYLSNDRYLQLKAARLNKAEHKLTIKFSEGPASAGVSVTPKSLGVQALRDSFKKIQSELSVEIGKTDPKVISMLDEASTQFSDAIVKSERYEVGVDAQWLRLVTGGGASSTFDWKAKKAQIQGNLQAKLVLCEGKTVARYAFPSLKGWMMKFGGEDLGAIRAVVSCELYGFAGAKFVAAGAVGVSWQGAKQVVSGIKKDRNAPPLSRQMDPRRGLPVFDPVSPYEAVPEDLNGVKADIDAFAGAEASITPGGQLQWLPPDENEFVSFAEVSATLGGTLGAGFNGKVYVYLAKGKFRVRMAAGLCFGVGAKGALEFTVNAEKLFQFAKWVHYQLLNAGVKKLVYIAKDAFMALSQLLLLLIQEGISLLDGVTAEQARQTEAYLHIEDLCQDIDGSFLDWLKRIDLAKTRNELVRNINRKPALLVHATPETRGMLLYQITRHGTVSHLRDAPSIGGAGLFPDEVHFMPSHKEAINHIMATVQTAREWTNVMEHMTEDGEKSPYPVGRNEGDVIRFLNNGISLVEDLPVLMREMNQRKDVKKTDNTYLDAYLEMRNKARNDFPKGYTVVRLDAPHLDLVLPGDGREHPQFAYLQTAEVGEAYAGDVGGSLV